jgi:RHS repeat-associated protein
MRRALFFIVVVLFAATSFASIPTRAREDASQPFAPLSETRVWASEVLAPFERPAESELSRAVGRAYVDSSTTSASGLRCFLSFDPTWESADLGRPQSWNRYSYVLNNPVRYTDPDGRCTDVLTCTIEGFSVGNVPAAVIGGTVGFVIGYGVTHPDEVAVLGNSMSGGGSAGERFAENWIRQNNANHMFESKSKPGSTTGPKGRPSKTVQQQAADETRDAKGQSRCANCDVPTSEPGAKPKPVESKRNADHIIPDSKGGDKTIDNIQWTCETCNKSAQDDPQPKTTGADKLRPPL